MAFTLAFPSAGLLIGYLLSPPYVLSPIPAKHRQRGTKIVSAVSVAHQNTGAVICCAIFPLGKLLGASEYLLLGAMVTIVVVLVVMLGVGNRFAAKQETVSNSTGQPLSDSAAAGAMAPASSA